MTAADYLKARGWFDYPEGSAGSWLDPRHLGGGAPCDDMCMSTLAALTIQRARDATEERAAWVAFAARFAGTFVAETEHTQGGYWLEDHFAAKKADCMLAEYRARFAVEVTP